MKPGDLDHVDDPGVEYKRSKFAEMVRGKYAGKLDSPPVVRDRALTLTVECAQDVDGRWCAEVPELPGVLAYGGSRDEALAKVQMLAFRVLVEHIEHDLVPLSTFSMTVIPP